MIIDTHPHIISADTRRYPVTPQAKRSDWSATRPATFEQLAAAMDEAGVDKAAIVHSSTTYGYNNAYLADVIEGHRGRFTGVFAVDMLRPDAPEQIRHWASRQLTGLRLYTGGKTLDRQSDVLGDRRIIPAWETAGELGLTVCVLLRQEGLPSLVALARRYPQTPILIDHLLSPPIEEGPPYQGSQFLFDLAEQPNIYLKLTTSCVRRSRKGSASPQTFFPRLVGEFGANRIAWGSNYPASEGSLAQIVSEAKAALSCLGAPDREWIFARTAQRLYPALAG